MLYLTRPFATKAEAVKFLRDNELFVDLSKTGRFLIGCEKSNRRLAWSAMAVVENGRVLSIE